MRSSLPCEGIYIGRVLQTHSFAIQSVFDTLSPMNVSARMHMTTRYVALFLLVGVLVTAGHHLFVVASTDVLSWTGVLHHDAPPHHDDEQDDTPSRSDTHTIASVTPTSKFQKTFPLLSFTCRRELCRVLDIERRHVRHGSPTTRQRVYHATSKPRS